MFLDDWLPTDALAYCVLDVAVLKGEVVDDTGLREDIEGGHWFLTSSNHPNLALPSLGVHGPKRFRDGHYGYDDFARWPQFFTANFEHHAFVPRYCEKLSRLWWVVTREECPVIPGAVALDVRVLNPAIVDEFKAHCEYYCAEVAEALKSHQEDRAPLWVTSMCDTLDRLSMGLSFRTITQEVAEFQRLCLEIHGWLNMVTTFLPRALRQTPQDNTSYPVDSTIMGAFTHEVAVAQRFHRIGVPVYLLRPSALIPHNMNVKESKPSRPRRMALSPGSPMVMLDDYHMEKKGAYPFPTLAPNLPGTRLQETLQRIRFPVLRRGQARVVGAAREEEKLGERGSQSIAVRTIPCAYLLEMNAWLPLADGALQWSLIC